MHQSVLLILFNIVPIWVVVMVFRLTQVPLKTDIPTKFGTVLIIYGILIPAAPLHLTLHAYGFRFTDLFHILIGNKRLLGIYKDPITWFQFFVRYYTYVGLAAVGFSLLYSLFSRFWIWSGFSKLNWLRTWIMDRLDSMDVVDETQVLVLQAEGPLEMDIFQGRYVYCGKADSNSITGLFGTKSITLKEVNRLHISKARQGTPTATLIANHGVPLKEVVFPLKKVVNYNIRRQQKMFVPAPAFVESLKKDIK